MNYHQYPVPVEGITGVDAKLANDPVINISDDKIAGLRVLGRDGQGPAAAQPALHGVQGRLTMAVADATSAAPAASRSGGRVTGALLGLLLLGVAIGLYTQLGTLGLGLPAAVVLLLVCVPVFVLAGAGIRHVTGADRAEH